jgi:hypothetical protein
LTRIWDVERAVVVDIQAEKAEEFGPRISRIGSNLEAGVRHRPDFLVFVSCALA